MGRIDALYEALSCEKDLVVRRDEPMAFHTTFRIGGPVDLFVMPGSIGALQKAIRLCHTSSLTFDCIGKGSNLLVSDEGVRGALIWIGEGLNRMAVRDDGTIQCGAGADLSKLCRFAQRQGLAGLEFAYGIPGSVGGAAFMNAGAYGGEMKDVLLCCDHIARDGSLGRLAGDSLELSYRRSAYHQNGCVITGVTVALRPGDPAEIGAKMDELMGRRREKQPLELPSAGSVFKRPKGRFVGPMIEECGLKGYRAGGAMVSEKHAGFIVNAGGATCSDVLRLIDEIKCRVQDRFGVELTCEIRRMGV